MSVLDNKLEQETVVANAEKWKKIVSYVGTAIVRSDYCFCFSQKLELIRKECENMEITIDLIFALVQAIVTAVLGTFLKDSVVPSKMDSNSKYSNWFNLIWDCNIFRIVYQHTSSNIYMFSN